MAHNLFDKRMAFVNERPWHGLGTPVEKTINSEEMLKASGLDWRVSKVPATGARAISQGDKPVIYDRYFLCRDKIKGETEKPVLGLVSQGYEVLQNSEAFAFFEPLLTAGSCTYETAGALGNGERVWVQVRMKGAIEVAKDDVVDRFLLLSNSHDGRGAVSMRFTPIRVVCQNTLNLASKGGENSVSVRHSRNMRDRMNDEQVDILLKLISETYQQAQKQFKAMAKKKVTSEMKTAFLSSLFPITANQKKSNDTPLRWQMTERALQDDIVSPQATRDTLWGLYNAVTRVEDYRAAREAGEGARLSRVWFGASADLKVKALTEAVALCA